jgi:methylenetetrahydrofolate reductase (NADPH)
MTSMSGARIPDELAARLASVAHDDHLTGEIGVEWAVLQCRELLEHGAPGIHFYTLNRSPASRAILQQLRQG